MLSERAKDHNRAIKRNRGHQAEGICPECGEDNEERGSGTGYQVRFYSLTVNALCPSCAYANQPRVHHEISELRGVDEYKKARALYEIYKNGPDSRPGLYINWVISPEHLAQEIEEVRLKKIRDAEYIEDVNRGVYDGDPEDAAALDTSEHGPSSRHEPEPKEYTAAKVAEQGDSAATVQGSQLSLF